MWTIYTREYNNNNNNKKETDSQAENKLVVTSWEGEVDRGKIGEGD